MIKPAILALGLIGLTSVANASEMTVGDLRLFCNSSDEVAQTACRFYIFGVLHGARISDEAHSAKTKFSTCVPETVTIYTITAAVRAQMNRDVAAFPADEKEPAVALVIASLAHTFPCKQ